MTTSHANASRSILRSALLGAATLLAIACGGSSTSGNVSQGVKPGDPCAASGAHASATDGCNTCTCSEGAWACTEMACVDAGPGAGGSGAGGVVGTGGKIGTGGKVGAGGSGGCQTGTTMNDGCNTCTCSGGGWQCTDRACPPPAMCAPGTTMNDGCNTCTCVGGAWACTKRACPAPAVDAGPAPTGKACGARAGNTCTANEYCAYQAGQYCGGADAESVCMPRPGACTEQYDPVCGCDGSTYSNACFANAAGTGIMSSGPCASASF